MKHYTEGKIALKTAISKLSFLLLVLFFTQKIYSQIPINGFCKYDQFKVDEGFDEISSLNFNHDKYSDIVLLSLNQKNISTLTGEIQGQLNSARKTSTQFPISSIEAFTDHNNKILYHVFVSRKARRVGLSSFSTNGYLSINHSIRFNSFPENIAVADIDNDGVKEILVSGPAFDGLSILRKKSSRLIEEKIVSNKIFSESIFINLDGDEFIDLLAFDLIEQTLNFFINNGRGEFRIVRNMQFQKRINSIQTFDFNLDTYPDILFSSGDEIKIIYGDAYSSYSKQQSVPTNSEVGKFIYADFNRDGEIDLAYLNKKNSFVSVILKKNETEFFDEIRYLEKTGLVDLIPYYSRFVNGLISLSSNGKVYTITNLISLREEPKISVGGNPDIIRYFDYAANGIIDLFFVDKKNKKLNFLLRNKDGIFEFFYSINLSESFNNFYLDDEDGYNKKFYFYNHGEKLIEVLNVDLNLFQYTKNYFYAEGGIEDLRISKNSTSNISDINLLFINDTKLGRSVISFRDFRYVTTTSVIDENVLEAKIDEKTNVHYWKQSGNILEQKFFVNSVPHQYETIKQITDEGFQLKFSSLFDLRNEDQELLLTFLTNSESSFFVLANQKIKTIINDEFLEEIFLELNSEQLFWGMFKPNALNKLFIYLPDKNLLTTIEFLRKRNRLITSRVTEIGNIGSYFIRRMTYGQFYLVAHEENENVIIFKKV